MSDDFSGDQDNAHLKQTLNCVKQMTRDFGNLESQLRRDNTSFVALSGQLQRIGTQSSRLQAGAATPLEMQRVNQSLVMESALQKQLLRDTNEFTKSLNGWAKSLRTYDVENMMEIDPPISSDPISESLTLVNLAGIPATVEGIGTLMATGTRNLINLAYESMDELTKAMEERLTGGAASRLAPDGGLQTSERLGGHLLTKHVGRTEAQLLSRAMTDASTPGLASSFFDRATAEAAASQAI